jgi:hypothetical protein
LRERGSKPEIPNDERCRKDGGENIPFRWHGLLGDSATVEAPFSGRSLPGDSFFLFPAARDVLIAAQLAIIFLMDSREERLARNEAAARDINERLEEAHDTEPSDRYVRMTCECGRDFCDRVIAIKTAEYEEIRSDPLQFIVVRDHLIPDVERIVAETDRFVIVAKREGTPASVAIEEDPRS